MANERAIQLANERNKMTAQMANQTMTALQKYQEEGRLTLPKNYAAENALKQLQLIIMDNDDVMNCTPASIMNMMLDMVVMGLNPAKNQCYPIAYGDKATLFVSYFGHKAQAMRIDPNIKDIIAVPIRKGEEFEYETTVDGYANITKHKSTLESLSSNEYLGGYASILYKDGTVKSKVMPIKRIYESWKMSRQKVFNEDGSLNPKSTHAKFTDEMIKRTLINSITKDIINTSSDESLYCETVQRNILEYQQAEAAKEAEENVSDGEFVDVDFDDAPESAFDGQ